MNFDKTFIPLQKAYKLKLQEQLNKNINELSSPMDYFITYLKFLRDYHLYETQDSLEETIKDVKIISIMTAIEEYEKFQNCIHNYYNVSKQTISRKENYSEEEASTKYANEKKFHWNAFWNLINLNMESWMIENA